MAPEPTSEPAIRIDNLVKRYGAKDSAKDSDGGGKLALKGVSFDVPEGGIFGLLGPNGAGKSTLINILAGLVDKTDGSAEIWGFDIDRQRRNAKRSIGIVPQEIVFDPFFTPFEVLENQAGFYGIPKAERRSEELLEAVRLSDKRDAYARTLSGGMKRRLLIAKAMVHSPPILVCDRIAIINHGELIANKPTRELIGMAREKIVSVSVDMDLAGPIMEEAFVKAEVVEPRRLDVTYDRDATTAGQILSLIQHHGYAIEDVTTREADLEDVFVQLTAAV